MELESDFDEIAISTETIIGKTNAKINITDLFDILPVTPYTVCPKKRGRRPKAEPTFTPPPLSDGDIITLKLGDRMRGVDLKGKKKQSDKKAGSYFRNSITIVMNYDGKLINFKISKNGKFQFTGCKNGEQAHQCLDWLIRYVYAHPQSRRIISTPLTESFCVVYLTVMANINFSLGFCVNKERLDEHINQRTPYYSLLETTFGYTGVNIKIPLPSLDRIPINKMTFSAVEGTWFNELLNYQQYLCLLEEKDLVKEQLKVRYNTFLVFQSGNVILSSPHKECMRSTYHEFLEIIRGCRPVIEERLTA